MGKPRKTTEQFIEKAIAKHGAGKFDYSAVVYVGAIYKVTITCSEGHTFDQRASDHLRRRGCPQCYGGGGARHTTESFIEKARAVHGDKYDYSKVVYVNRSTKVTITCRDGHTFEQTPQDHIKGRGCGQCAGVVPYTNEQFIKKAIARQGLGKYDYSAVVYVASGIKVTITCRDGHTFEQTPACHLQGKGCPQCYGGVGVYRTTESFIEKARAVHGDKFDYSAVVYKGGSAKVTIICPEGHTFDQEAKSHLQGKGCLQCYGGLRHTTDSFIAKAIAKHGRGKFDYSAVEYKGAFAKVTIICPEGHTFDQLPTHHLSGSGCGVCSPGGYDVNKEATLYYLRVTDRAGVIRYKIGITNNSVQRRYCKSDMEMIDILGEYRHGNGANPLAKETFVLRHFAHAKYQGPDILKSVGITEIFNYDVLGLEDGGDLLKAVQKIQRDVIRRQVA